MRGACLRLPLFALLEGLQFGQEGRSPLLALVIDPHDAHREGEGRTPFFLGFRGMYAPPSLADSWYRNVFYSSDSFWASKTPPRQKEYPGSE